MPTPEYVKQVQAALPSTTSTTTRTVPVTYDARKTDAAFAAAYKINPHLSYADFVRMPTAEETQAKQGEIKTAKPKTEQEKKDSKRAMEVQAYKEEEAKKEERPVKSVMQGLDILLAPTLPSTWIDAGLYFTGHPTYFRDYTTGEYKPHYLPAAIDDSHTNITPYAAFVTDLFGYSLANKAVRGATRVGSAMAKDAKGAVSELIHPNYRLHFTPLNYLDDTAKMRFKTGLDAYMKAVQEGDMKTALKLRGLHFVRNTPDSYTHIKVYHGTEHTPFTLFNDLFMGEHLNLLGKGFYTTPNKSMAMGFGRPMELYVNMKKPIKRFKMLDNMTSKAEDILFNRVSLFEDSDILFNWGDGNYDYVIKSPYRIKSAEPVTYFKATDPEVLSGLFKAGDVIPLSMRDDFSRNDIRFNTNDIYSTILGKTQPFDVDALYNKMLQIELDAIELATKEGFNTAEQDIMSYLGSEKHILQIMKSGLPREVAERVALLMKQNADNSNVSFDWLPSTEGGEHHVKFNTEYELNPNKETIWQKIFGGYKKYINPKEVLTNEVTINNSTPRSSDDFRSVINHEVGGHSADLGVNPEASYFNSPSYLYRLHNTFPDVELYIENQLKLKPVRKPEYIDSNDDMISYLEELSEYSTRARNMQINPKLEATKIDWDLMKKYFTKESLDKLLKYTWGVLPIATGIGLSAASTDNQQALGDNLPNLYALGGTLFYNGGPLSNSRTPIESFQGGKLNYLNYIRK